MSYVDYLFDVIIIIIVYCKLITSYLVSYKLISLLIIMLLIITIKLTLYAATLERLWPYSLHTEVSRLKKGTIIMTLSIKLLIAHILFNVETEGVIYTMIGHGHPLLNNLFILYWFIPSLNYAPDIFKWSFIFKRMPK